MLFILEGISHLSQMAEFHILSFDVPIVRLVEVGHHISAKKHFSGLKLLLGRSNKSRENGFLSLLKNMLHTQLFYATGRR